MPKFYAVIGSITTTSRLKRELEMRGIHSHIVPTPNSTSGCSYSLLLPESSRSVVMQFSKKYKINKFIDAGSGDGL